MSSAAEHTVRPMSPGIVRRAWWRTSQPVRLTIIGIGVLAALAATGAAGFTNTGAPHEDTGLEATVHRGDAIDVTVRTVSDVDTFEGLEPATGLYFHARVTGIRRTTDCWRSESRAAAQNLLLGKDVRLTVRKDGFFEDDRIAVDVRLPDGADYAQTVVRQGAVMADLVDRGELSEAESTAREERRGLWAAGCAIGDAATTSSVPTSSTSVPATTTTTATPESSSSPEPPSSTVTVTTSGSGNPSLIDVLLGRQCFREGARKTRDGVEMVCARDDEGQLRWRRAD